MRKRGAAIGPLKKIIGTDTAESGVQLEILECGHVVHRKQDIYGPTNAYRRRCRFCRKEKEASAGDK